VLDPIAEKVLLYEKKGQYDKAISDYNKAIEINPGYAAAYNNRGAAYYDNGQYDRACSDWKPVVFWTKFMLPWPKPYPAPAGGNFLGRKLGR